MYAGNVTERLITRSKSARIVITRLIGQDFKEAKNVGAVLMLKRQCVCGEHEGVELMEGESAFRSYWIVKCTRCGKVTAKHMDPEGAIRDWNHMEDRESGHSEEADRGN
jgi:hypothetical protein